jgi:hypothetical protein
VESVACSLVWQALSMVARMISNSISAIHELERLARTAGEAGLSSIVRGGGQRLPSSATNSSSS